MHTYSRQQAAARERRRASSGGPTGLQSSSRPCQRTHVRACISALCMCVRATGHISAYLLVFVCDQDGELWSSRASIGSESSSAAYTAKTDFSKNKVIKTKLRCNGRLAGRATISHAPLRAGACVYAGREQVSGLEADSTLSIEQRRCG